MSQRLHIGQTEEQFYDCILTKPKNVTGKLINEWLQCDYDNGIFLSPFKIMISDMDLYKKIEPVISIVLNAVGKKYPDDIWVFYYKDKTIKHPSANELQAWIKNLTEEIE